MQSPAKKIYTFADYEQLPEGAPYQLIQGELVMTPSATPYHQIILQRLLVHLTAFVRQLQCGEVIVSPIDVYFNEREVYQPDIIFIHKERLNIIGKKKIEGPPDLVMEILSPSTGYYDLTHKKSVYESSGVQEYWVIDPEEKFVEVFALHDGRFRESGRWKGDGTAASTLLPGFQTGLATLFKPIGEL